MKDLLKHFFVYGLGGTIGKFIGLFLLPIYASVFTPDDYGTLDFIIALSSIFSVFGMIQIETGMQRFYFEQSTKEEQRRLISTVFIFTLVCSLLVSIATISFIPLISNIYFNSHYRLELLFSFLSIIPSNLLVIILIILRYQKRSKIYVIISLSQVLLSTFLAIYAVKLGFGILGVLLTSTAVSYLTLVASIIVLKCDISLITFDKGKFIKMFSFGAPQFPARLGSISNVYLNRFVMISMLSVAAIGLYSVALRVASGMQLIYTAFQLAWIPFLYELITKKSHKIELVRIYELALAILSFLVVIVALFAKEVILLLTNYQYLESYRLVAILTFYFALFILKEIVDIGVKITKKAKYVSYIYFVSVAVNVALLFGLTPYYELTGVALSLLISNLVLFFLTLLVSEKLYPVQFPLFKSILVLLFTFFVVCIPLFADIEFEYRLCFGILLTLFIAFLYHKRIKEFIIRIKYVK